MKKVTTLIFLFSVVFFASCENKSSSTEATESSNEEMNAESTEKIGADAEIKEGQRVYFGNLSDGDQVTSPFTVQMNVEGMEVEPAGEVTKDKGHHHILINKEYVPKGEVVPTDSLHIHFGKGQTETELDLAPGNYIISLQFADGVHRSYGQKMSTSINIEVTEEM